MTVPGSDIKWISWIRCVALSRGSRSRVKSPSRAPADFSSPSSPFLSVARNYQMRLGTPKQRTTFDGFVKEDFERLSNLCKQYYNITIETKDISVRGWNWGVAEVQCAFPSSPSLQH